METFVTDKASNNSWAKWNTANVSITVKWTTGFLPRKRGARDTLREGVHTKVSGPLTSEFFKGEKKNNNLEFTHDLYYAANILTERALLREKNNTKDTAKKKKCKRDHLVLEYIVNAHFFPLVFRALTYDITHNWTIQHRFSGWHALRPTYKSENTIWSLINVQKHYINVVAWDGTGLHAMTQKIYATPLCLEQALSMQSSLLYGCILFLAFDLFRHLESKTYANTFNPCI